MKITIKKAMQGLVIMTSLLATSGFAQAELIGNGGFEYGWVDEPTEGTGFDYNPSDADGELAWSFLDESGISESDTHWHGIAESGDNFAFLQRVSTIYQDFTLTETGSLILDFSWTARERYPAIQNLQVKIDDYFVFEMTADSYGWTQESITLGNLEAGTYTLTFVTTPTGSVDQAVFLDNVSLVSNEYDANLEFLQDVFPVPTPLSTLGALSMALLAFREAKNKKSLNK
jgi:hypothetical protein